MAKINSRKALAKAQWERGYSSHGYWLGKDKLGDVRQSGKGKVKGEGETRYQWQAGNRTGETMTLVDAKRMVETLTEQGVTQMGLFED